MLALVFLSVPGQEAVQARLMEGVEILELKPIVRLPAASAAGMGIMFTQIMLLL